MLQMPIPQFLLFEWLNVVFSESTIFLFIWTTRNCGLSTYPLVCNWILFSPRSLKENEKLLNSILEKKKIKRGIKLDQAYSYSVINKIEVVIVTRCMLPLQTGYREPTHFFGPRIRWMGQKTRYNQSDWFYVTVERNNVSLPVILFFLLYL